MILNQKFPQLWWDWIHCGKTASQTIGLLICQNMLMDGWTRSSVTYFLWLAMVSLILIIIKTRRFCCHRRTNNAPALTLWNHFLVHCSEVFWKKMCLVPLLVRFAKFRIYMVYIFIFVFRHCLQESGNPLVLHDW